MDSLLTTPEFPMSMRLFVAPGGYLIASQINQYAIISRILAGLTAPMHFFIHAPAGEYCRLTSTTP